MIRDIIKNPLCSQAIANCKHWNWRWQSYVREVLNYEHDFKYAITHMFNWEMSPQGDEYWRMLYERGDMPQGLCDWDT